jgi:ABC-type transporter MlaC component
MKVRLGFMIQIARRTLPQCLHVTLTAVATVHIDKCREKPPNCRLFAVRSAVRQKTEKNIMFPYRLRQSGKWLTVVSLQLYGFVPSRGGLAA